MAGARMVIERSGSRHADINRAALLQLLDAIELAARNSSGGAARTTTRPRATGAPAPAAATGPAPTPSEGNGEYAVTRMLSMNDAALNTVVDGRPLIEWLDAHVGMSPSDDTLITIPGMLTPLATRDVRKFLQNRLMLTLSDANTTKEVQVMRMKTEALKDQDAVEQQQNNTRERRLAIAAREQEQEQAAKDAEVERQRRLREQEQAAKDAEAERQRRLLEQEQAAKDAESERQLRLREQEQADKAAEAERQRLLAADDAKRKREDDERAEAAKKRKLDDLRERAQAFWSAPTWERALPFRVDAAKLKVAEGENTTLNGAKRSAMLEWRKAAAERAVTNEDDAPTEDNGNYALGPADGHFADGVIPPGVIAYYNGSADDIDARLAQHRAGAGSAVTRAFPYIHKREALLSPRVRAIGGKGLRENLETFYRMRKYGINHCRGGKYAQPVIDPRAAFTDICDCFSLCKRCGAKGHFAENCANARFDRFDDPF